MNRKEIIDKATRLVRYRLEDMEDANVDTVEMSKHELLSIAAALAVAGVMSRQTIN